MLDIESTAIRELHFSDIIFVVLSLSVLRRNNIGPRFIRKSPIRGRCRSWNSASPPAHFAYLCYLINQQVLWPLQGIS